MKNHTHNSSSSRVGNPNGREFEIECLYKRGDPRARVIESIDFQTVEYRHLAAAVLDAINRNPTGYTGKELWDPPTGWASDVHFHIAQRLELKDWRNLTIVPSLKTSADIHHGIDFIVVYHEPETDRDVIVTIDLSLKDKSHFKADILVNESDVVPNIDYYNTPVRHIPDPAEHRDPAIDKMIRESLPGARRKALGETIAALIKEKLRSEDPHYGKTMKTIGAEVHNRIAALVEPIA